MWTGMHWRIARTPLVVIQTPRTGTSRRVADVRLAAPLSATRYFRFWPRTPNRGTVAIIFAIARDGLYSGPPATWRPLPDLLPTRRRRAVTDNTSSVATRRGQEDDSRADVCGEHTNALHHRGRLRRDRHASHPLQRSRCRSHLRSIARLSSQLGCLGCAENSRRKLNQAMAGPKQLDTVPFFEVPNGTGCGLRTRTRCSCQEARQRRQPAMDSAQRPLICRQQPSVRTQR